MDEEEARKRLENFGANVFAEERKIRFWEIAREEITEPMILLLLAVGVLYSIWGSLEDAITIIAVVSTLVFVEVWNDFRAKHSIAALKKLASPSAPVLRNSHLYEVPTTQLVPVDVILLRAGQRVPADGRLLESLGLQVEES